VTARSIRAAVAALMGLPALLVVASGAGAGGDGDVVLERRWAAFAPESNVQTARVALDVAARTAYTFDSAAGAVTVRAWNLDTLVPRTAPLTEAGTPALDSYTPIAVDETRHVATVAVPAEAGDVPKVRTYAVRGGALVRAGEATTRFPAGYAVLGFGLDQPRGRVLVLGAPSAGGAAQVAGAAVGGVQLDVWKLDDLAQGRVAAAVAQPLRVPQYCGQVMSFAFPAAVVSSADGRTAYFGCLTNRGLVTRLTGPNLVDIGGIAELDLASSTLRLRPVAGDFSEGDTLVTAGPRIVLKANSAQATTIKVFDVPHGYYVGNVGVDSVGTPAVGVDRQRGRGYYVVQRGLGVFDAGVTPASQGVVYGDFAGLLGTLTRPIEVDHRTRRVFVATSDNTSSGGKPFVAVFRDRSPLPEPDPPAEQLTSLDLAEEPGLVESARTADAGAYGAEFRVVGGATALLFNATHFDSRGIVARPGTRWEQFGVARGMRLSPDEATAEVLAARQDNATAADFGSELSAPVACSDFGFTAGTATGDAASVTCDVAKQRASGSVATEPGRILVRRAQQDPAVLAPVQVRSAEVTVDVSRDGPLGKVVTTITSAAKGIDILGSVKIGEVVATARTETHGRPGTATTTYERTVTGLVVGGTRVCAGDCPIATVQQAVNDTFGGRVRVDFPVPDRYAAPNGTVARISDNAYRHIERTTLDDVEDDVVVTPAMEVVAYLDATASSRLVAGFAALSSQQRYRVYRVGSEEDDSPPAGGGPSAGPLPVPSALPTVEPDDHPPASPPPVAAPPAPGDVLTRLVEGMKVVFRSPRHIASVAALWALLALPTYLAARRRLLADLPYLRRVEEA
jgi:hypothetical protein